MASSTGITSISAEFSVGSATSKTMISMSTSRSGISMVTTSSITHGVCDSRKPQYSLMTLRPLDPLANQTVSFIKEVLKEYTTKSFKLYSYSLAHPATLAYTVLLGGLLFQYGISKTLAFALPPVLAFYCVKARLCNFLRNEALLYCADLVHPSRYYNERKRVLFLAVEENEASHTLCDTVEEEEGCIQDSFSRRSSPESILGTVAVDTEQAGGTAVIRHLCVHPKYRRHGIGQELLLKALAFCERERFSRIILSTNNLQGPASKLCLKHGFRRVTQTVDVTILPGVEITRDHFVRCLRSRHTSSCCH